MPVKSAYTREEVLAILGRMVVPHVTGSHMVTMTELRLRIDDTYACAGYAVTAQEAERERLTGSSFIADKDATARRLVAAKLLELVDEAP